MYRFTKILKIFQNSEFVVKVSRNSYYVGGLFPRWEYVRCIDDSFSQRAGSLKKSQNQVVKIKFPLLIRLEIRPSPSRAKILRKYLRGFLQEWNERDHYSLIPERTKINVFVVDKIVAVDAGK